MPPRLRKFARRRRRAARSYPLSRTVRRRTFRSGSFYSYGLPGTRFVRSSGGRDTPIYLSGRAARSPVEALVHPAGDDQRLHTRYFTNSNTTDAGASPFVHLNDISRGDSIGQRRGNAVKMLRVSFRGFFQANLDITKALQQVGTFMVVFDRQPRGQLPVLSDLLDYQEPFGMQRLDNRDRFHILYRKQLGLEVGVVGQTGTDTPVPTSNSMATIDVSIPIYRSTIFANGGINGVIADVRSGALYAVFVGPGNAASGGIFYPGIHAALHYRIVYSDS